MTGTDDYKGKPPSGGEGGVAMAVRRVFRSYARLITLVAAGILGIDCGTLFVGYKQVAATRSLAEGAQDGRIVSIGVAGLGGGGPWLAPPAALAKKLEAAILAPRHRPAWSSSVPLCLIRVKYSGGFTAVIPVRPSRGGLLIMYYRFRSNFSWENPNHTLVSPLQPLTPRELKWLYAATDYLPITPVAKGGGG
jgi:hypothetical protein